MTVDSMLSNMTQDELVYWMAYHKIRNEELEGKTSKKDSTSDTTKKKIKPIKPEDMKVGEDGFRIVPEEQQRLADENMLAFFETVKSRSKRM